MKRFLQVFYTLLVLSAFLCCAASSVFAAEGAGTGKGAGSAKTGQAKGGDAAKAAEAKKAAEEAAKAADPAKSDDAAKAESAVKNFEDRLESLTKELSAIRLELEALTKEMLEGETGVAQVFLKARAGEFADKSVSLYIDNKLILSRPLTPAELNVLGSDLPLELGEMRLGAGDHKAVFQVLGTPPEEPSKMPVARGKRATWIVTVSDGKVEWTVE